MSALNSDRYANNSTDNSVRQKNHVTLFTKFAISSRLERKLRSPRAIYVQIPLSLSLSLSSANRKRERERARKNVKIEKTEKEITAWNVSKIKITRFIRAASGIFLLFFFLLSFFFLIRC